MLARASAHAGEHPRGASLSTGSSERTAVAQYGQIFHAGSSGDLQRRHGSFSRVVQTGQTRYDGSTSLRQYGQRWSWPSRRSMARISSSRSRTSSRYSGGRRIM